MSLSTVLLYMAAWAVVAIIPGPSMMLMLSNGLTRNKRLILMGMLGKNLATVTIISAVAFGLGALLQTSEMLFAILKWAGTAYLLWLAWQMWHAQPKSECQLNAHPQPAVSLDSYTPLRAFKRCWLVAMSNPKGILFFTAFLPQFVSLDLPQAPQYLILAATTIVIDSSCMIVYITGGIQAARLLTSMNLKRLNRVSAICMACMAGWLALYRKA